MRNEYDEEYPAESGGAIARGGRIDVVEAGRLAAVARELERAARSANTRRAYEADWRHFTSWCASVGAEALPAAPETLVAYLAALSETARPATVDRRLAGIRWAHAQAGFVAPTSDTRVSDVRRGLRNVLGVRPDARQPALAEDVRAMVAALPRTLQGARDRALVLFGYASALRRSELVSIDVEHLSFTEDGARLVVAASKTDQKGEGAIVGVVRTRSRTCPVAALNEWIAASGIETGAVFRSVRKGGRSLGGRLSGHAVAVVVKQAALAAGLDPTRFAGHSLRSGLVTEAFSRGAAAEDIMRHTRHRRHETLMRYRHEGRLFHGNVSSKAGL